MKTNLVTLNNPAKIQFGCQDCRESSKISDQTVSKIEKRVNNRVSTYLRKHPNDKTSFSTLHSRFAHDYFLKLKNPKHRLNYKSIATSIGKAFRKV